MTLVLVVTFALILIGQFVLIKNKAKNPPPKPSTATAAEQSSAPLRRCDAARASSEAPRQTPNQGNLPHQLSTKLPPAKSRPWWRTTLYRIVFTNKGAQAKSWVLKKFKDEKGPATRPGQFGQPGIRLAPRPLHLRRQAA